MPELITLDKTVVKAALSDKGRNFRRNAPKLDELKEPIYAPLRLFTLWGAGEKKHADKRDTRTMLFLKDFKAHISAQIGSEPVFRIILCDEHAYLNRFDPSKIFFYMRDISELANFCGFEVMKLSEIWSRYKINESNIYVHTHPDEFESHDIKNEKLRENLQRSVERHSQRDNKEEGGWVYYCMRWFEAPVLEKEFNDWIFISFNAKSDFQEILPNMPTVYLHTGPHGAVDGPWFKRRAQSPNEHGSVTADASEGDTRIINDGASLPEAKEEPLKKIKDSACARPRLKVFKKIKERVYELFRPKDLKNNESTTIIEDDFSTVDDDYLQSDAVKSAVSKVFGLPDADSERRLTFWEDNPFGSDIKITRWGDEAIIASKEKPERKIMVLWPAGLSGSFDIFKGEMAKKPYTITNLGCVQLGVGELQRSRNSIDFIYLRPDGRMDGTSPISSGESRLFDGPGRVQAGEVQVNNRSLDVILIEFRALDVPDGN